MFRVCDLVALCLDLVILSFWNLNLSPCDHVFRPCDLVALCLVLLILSYWSFNLSLCDLVFRPCDLVTLCLDLVILSYWSLNNLVTSAQLDLMSHLEGSHPSWKANICTLHVAFCEVLPQHCTLWIKYLVPEMAFCNGCFSDHVKGSKMYSMQKFFKETSWQQQKKSHWQVHGKNIYKSFQ